MARTRMSLETPDRNYSINVGAGFDMAAGEWIQGPRGDMVLNGGIANFSVCTGPGNVGKSLILYYWQAKILTRVHSHEPLGMIYDSESNINPSRVNHVMSNVSDSDLKEFINISNPDASTILYTDRTKIYPDFWWSDFKKYLKSIAKDKSYLYEPFSSNGVKVMAKPPFPVIIDSWSKFDPKAVDDMMDKSKSEDGSTNTIFMKAGSFKTKVLGQIPTVASKPNVYFLTTAHVGSANDMNENKYSKPMKKLHDLKDGEVLKKVTEEFYYLTKLMWKVVGKRILKDDEKQPYYRVKRGVEQSEKDLYVVKLETLRSKHGGTGNVIEVVISQEDGVLEDVTYLYNLKNNNFALAGTANFASVFLPDVKVTRHTVRETMKKNKKLFRAMQIGYDLYQLKKFFPVYERGGLYVDPHTLYTGLIEKGYDWDDILTNTRNWWDDDHYNERPENRDREKCLTIVSLLEMYHGIYTPWWLEEKWSKNGKSRKRA
jgi:hypothetical protein